MHPAVGNRTVTVDPVERFLRSWIQVESAIVVVLWDSELLVGFPLYTVALECMAVEVPFQFHVVLR